MNTFPIPVEVLTARLTGAEYKTLLGLYACLENGGSTVQVSMEELANKIMLDTPEKLSRVTTGLQEKGLLTKRKVDFYAPLEYELKYPVPAKRAIRKAVKKSTKKYMKISLDDLPESISEETAREFIYHRANCIKVPLTQEAFRRAMHTAAKAECIGITPDQAIKMTINEGWRGIKLDWLQNRLPNYKIPPGNNPIPRRIKTTNSRDVSIMEQLANRDWAKS